MFVRCVGVQRRTPAVLEPLGRNPGLRSVDRGSSRATEFSGPDGDATPIPAVPSSHPLRSVCAGTSLVTSPGLTALPDSASLRRAGFPSALANSRESCWPACLVPSVWSRPGFVCDDGNAARIGPRDELFYDR